jgi:hypothetical protein
VFENNGSKNLEPLEDHPLFLIAAKILYYDSIDKSKILDIIGPSDYFEQTVDNKYDTDFKFYQSVDEFTIPFSRNMD